MNEWIALQVRLSFGDGAGDRGRRARSPPHTSGEARVPGLGKYDKLLLQGLYCNTNHQVNAQTTLNNTDSQSRTLFGGGKSQLPSLGPNERIKFRSTPSLKTTKNTVEDGNDFAIIRGNVLLQGRGVEGKYHVVDEIHRKETRIVDGVWCTFRHRERTVTPEYATITPVLEKFPPVDALCMAEQRKLHIHTDTGQQYSHSSAFPIRKLWSFPLGLLVERDTGVASNLTSVLGYPNLFSASTHLEELAPVLFLGSSTSATALALLVHQDSVVAGVADDYPLVLIFEPHSNVHSMWLARLTTPEEMEAAVELIHKVPVCFRLIA